MLINMQKLLFAILFCIYVSKSEAKPKKDYNYGLCTKNQFRCKNENCIKKSWFCDGHNHCGDNSDEVNCNSYNSYGCPTHYPFFQCHNRYRCIPKIWQCDGVFDCQDRSDELNCLNDVEKIAGALAAERKAVSWMKGHRKNVLGQGKWGRDAFRIAVAFYLNDAKFFSLGNTTGEELSYEVEARLLSRMLRKTYGPLSASELAIAIHALLVTCNDPREFYGMNFVEDLREIVNGQENYTSPFVLLALCNADDSMTQTDVNKLIKIAKEPLHPFWTDTQALALMALSCISERQGSLTIPKCNDIASSLRLQQSSDGSIESPRTTALVTQALLSSGEENDDEWNMEAAVKYLMKSQKQDGSFGSFLSTYFALPIFRYKSLLNISSNHCPNTSKDDETVVQDMRDKFGKRGRVLYSLWFGDKVDVAKVLDLRVSLNSSFFDVMRYAAALDNQYKFDYSVIKGRRYIYALSEVQDDPEKDKYWFLYRSSNATMLPELVEKDPSIVHIHDREHFIMWYRTGHWNHQQLKETEMFDDSFEESRLFFND